MRLPGLALLILVACKGDDDTTPDDTTADADTDTDTDADTDADTDTDTDSDADTDLDDDADIRFVHVSEVLGPVDIYVDGATTPVIGGFPPFAGTPFQSMPATAHMFAMGPAGAPPDMSYATASATLGAGQRFTLVLYGPLALPVLTGVVEDIAGLDPGEVRFRIWNVVATIPEIDVVDEGTAMPLVTNLAYGAFAMVDVPASAHDLVVDTNDDGTPDLRFAVPVVGENVVVSLFFTLDSGAPILLGQPAGGGNPVKMPAEILNPPPVDTSDTGPL